MKLSKKQQAWLRRQSENFEIGPQWNNARPCVIPTKTHSKKNKIPLIIHTTEMIIENKIDNLMKKIGYE